MNGGDVLPDFTFHDWHTALLRLALALAAGGIIGMDREWRNKPAGLRTHAVVSMAAALAMMISIAMHAATQTGGSIPYGVVTGIGFIGGGAIIRYGQSVRGLVTGASIWSSAVIGLGFGLGWYISSGIAAVLILASLWVLQYVEMLLNPTQEVVAVRAKTKPGVPFPKQIFKELPQLQFEILGVGFRPGFGEDHGCICFKVKTPSNLSADVLVSILSTEDWAEDVEKLDEPNCGDECASPGPGAKPQEG